MRVVEAFVRAHPRADRSEIYPFIRDGGFEGEVLVHAHVSVVHALVAAHLPLGPGAVEEVLAQAQQEPAQVVLPELVDGLEPFALGGQGALLRSRRE